MLKQIANDIESTKAGFSGAMVKNGVIGNLSRIKSEITSVNNDIQQIVNYPYL